MTVRILQGDCRAVMATLPEASVDAIVCDPPYELTGARPGGRSEATRGKVMGGFMGMKWDGTGVAFDVETWQQALRVLKPGGMLLAFGGTRTFHRLACAIEDAGFELRDTVLRGHAGGEVTIQTEDCPWLLAWGFGSGFPKSHNGPWGGTALKPAWEPIVMARKPLIDTVEANWREHGTGALNIEGCRVGDEVRHAAFTSLAPCHGNALGAAGTAQARRGTQGEPKEYVGRWPANVLHDGSDEVLAAFPQAPGQMADASSSSRAGQNVYGAMKRGNGRDGEASADSANGGCVGFKMKPGARRGDAGSAARFFASFPQEAACSPSSAGTAPANSFLRSVLGSSVQSGAAIWPSLAGTVSSDSTEPSTSVTASESRTLCEAVITAMVPIGSESLRDSRHERLSPCGSRVSVAVRRSLTGTTTITASLCRSDGSVAAATFSITPTPLDLGAQGFARFRYCAKADRADRNEGLADPGPQFKMGRLPHDAEQVEKGKRGNHHPTVKPTDLMRYLCRLVTPPGGLVLDPFMGSGSTLKAAELEGFSAIGIELDEAYIEIARRRIAADAPLFAEVA